MNDIETISLRTIIELIEKNYINYVYNKGFSGLVNMFPTVEPLTNMIYRISDIEVRTMEIKGEKCLGITLVYEYLSQLLCKNFILSKNNDIFFIITKDFSLTEQKKILKEINFNNIYNYFVENLYSNYTTITGKYSNGEKKLDLDVDLSKDSVTINEANDNSFALEYKMMLGQLKKREHLYDMNRVCSTGNGYELIKLKSTDPFLLDNIRVNIIDLPEYMQNIINSRSLDTNKQDDVQHHTPKLTSKIKLKKIFSKI